MSDLGLDDRTRRTLLWMNRVRELTPFTPVVQHAMATLEDSRSSARDLANIINQDEAMAAKILRLVNSAFYGVRGKVTTISQAVPLLGFEQLRMAIVGVALFEQRRIRDPFAEENRKTLWEHSSTCARWATALAGATQYHPVEEVSLAAMLHDIGKIVIGIASPREFMISTKLCHSEGLASCDAEDRVLGINHLEVGKLVAEYWRFPPIVRYAIAQHHRSLLPAMDGAGPQDVRKAWHLLAIVRVANNASKESLAGCPPASDSNEVRVTISSEELVERAREVGALLQT